jgi:hypothetical protein
MTRTSAADAAPTINTVATPSVDKHRTNKFVFIRLPPPALGQSHRTASDEQTGGLGSNVRFGSKADMCGATTHVRFTPKSGHVQRTSLCLLWAKSGHWTNLVRRLFGSAYEVLTGLGPYLKQKGSGENRSPIARRFLCSRRLAAERASLAWFLCLARRAKGPRIGTVPPRYSRPVHQTGFARMRWGAGHASSCGCLCCGKARTQRKSSNCCQ